MTTTTSSPDRRFWTLLRGLLRRNLGAMIYFFLVTCFFFPVQYFLEIFGNRWNLDPVYWSAPDLYGPAQIYTAFSMVVMVIILLAAPVVIATSQMHYLHTRRSVDLYHSLPVTRRQLMLASGLGSFLTMAVPMTANYLLILLGGCIRQLTLPAGAAFTVRPLEMLLDAAGWGVTHLFIIAVILLVATQVGSSFENFVLSCELLIAPFLLVLITDGFCSWHLLGYVSRLTLEDMSRLTPLALMIQRYSITLDRDSTAQELLKANLMILIWLVLGILVLALALRLYDRRRSELAETSGIRGPLGLIAKAIAVFIGASAIGGVLSLFGVYGSSKGSFVLWTTVGAAFTAVLMEAVLNRGFKGIKRALPLGGAMTAVMLALALIVTNGGLGYETRVPALGKIQAVTIDTRGRFDYASVLDHTTERSYTTTVKWDENRKEYHYSSHNTVTLEDPEAVELVRQIHAEMVRWAKYREQGLENSETAYPSRISHFQYRLAGGSLERQYDYWWGADAVAEDLFWQLQAQPEFIEKTCPLFFTQPEDYREVQTLGRLGLAVTAHIGDRQQIGAIMEALKADLLSEDLESVRSGKATTLGTLYFDRGSFQSASGYLTPLEEDQVLSYSVRVYAHYTNTLRVLKELGLEDALADPPMEEIPRLMVSNYSWGSEMAHYLPGRTDEEYGSEVISDPDQISQLLQLAREMPECASDRYWSGEEDTIYLVPVNGSGQLGVQLQIPVSEAPAYLLEYFPYLLEKVEAEKSAAAIV